MTALGPWDATLSVPDNWYLHDPDPATAASTAAADVDARIRERPDLARHRHQIIEALRSFGQEAVAKGALIAATYWEPQETGAVAANLMLLAARREAFDDLGAELGALQRGLARPGRADVGPRDVEQVDLPAGPAVRLQLLATTDESEKGLAAVVLAAVQYWVPVPGHPDMVVLSGTTSRLDGADELGEIFDSIARTLRFAEVDDE